MNADKTLGPKSELQSIDDRHMVIDDIMEDHVHFNCESVAPLMNSTQFYADIEARKEELHQQELARRAKSPSFLERSRFGVIVTPCRKTHEEMTSEERSASLFQFWKDADKHAIRAFCQDNGAGDQETQAQWARRMGLKAPKNRDQRLVMDWTPYIQSPVPPTPSEIAWIFGSLYDSELTKNDEGYPERCMTDEDTDVLEMSWPEQRAFRWRNPDGYAAWVKALKEEMGPHFDESLILPEWKGVVIEKAREVDEADLGSNDAAGEFTPESAKSTEVVH